MSCHVRFTASRSLLVLLGCLVISNCSQAPTPSATSMRYRTQVTVGGVLAGGTIDRATWRHITTRAEDAVYLVRNEGCGFTATGSGFAISPTEVVTNNHVVEDAHHLSVESPAGDDVPVRWWEKSETDDLALLHLGAAFDATPLRAATKPATPGDLVAVIGHPLGGRLTIGRGRILTVKHKGAANGILESSTDVLPGNSGGPLLDTDGNFIGVVYALNLETGSALAIPAVRVNAGLMNGSTSKGVPCR
jgi:S1-C subfamily serine protease